MHLTYVMKIKTMKTTFLKRLLLCVGMVGALSSCSLDDDSNYVTYPQPDLAYGLIINASPASGDLFFYADANQINNTALNYAKAAGYYNFILGDRVLTVRNASGQVLATDSITLTRDKVFSTFAVNTFNNIELVTYNDSLVVPAIGKARVRFINLSPDADSINVSGTMQTFATGLAFKEATEFIEVPAGNYDFTFKDSESEDTLFHDTAVQFADRRVYTIYTKGYKTPPANSNDTFSTEVVRNL